MQTWVPDPDLTSYSETFFFMQVDANKDAFLPKHMSTSN